MLECDYKLVETSAMKYNISVQSKTIKISPSKLTTVLLEKMFQRVSIEVNLSIV